MGKILSGKLKLAVYEDLGQNRGHNWFRCQSSRCPSIDFTLNNIELIGFIMIEGFHCVSSFNSEFNVHMNCSSENFEVLFHSDSIVGSIRSHSILNTFWCYWVDWRELVLRTIFNVGFPSLSKSWIRWFRSTLSWRIQCRPSSEGRDEFTTSIDNYNGKKIVFNIN